MVIKKKEQSLIDINNLPKHIAFICDGNRRWARAKGFPTMFGHKEGAEAVKRIIKRASELGIENLSFFCFSTENFNRSEEEVNYLFEQFKQIEKLIPEFVKYDYKFHHSGDRNFLLPNILRIIDKAEKQTQNCKRGYINISLSYGGRNDIVNATKKIIKANLLPEEVTEESFKKYLSTNPLPDVDLMVRSSGEQRISGFMLYDMAYAELYFVDKHWPAFLGRDLDDCVIEYQKRNRRFGK